MDRKVTDTIRVTDAIKISGIKNTPSILLQQYYTHREAITKDSDDGEYLVLFLFLQVYLENHFHYYLGFLIGEDMGRGKRFSEWDERDSVLQKLLLFELVIYRLKLAEVDVEFKTIKRYYTKINKIRNAIAHGHKISKTVGNGKTHETFLRNIFNQPLLNLCKIEENTLEIKQGWSSIIKKVCGDKGAIDKSPLPNASFWSNCEINFTISENWLRHSR